MVNRLLWPAVAGVLALVSAGSMLLAMSARDDVHLLRTRLNAADRQATFLSGQLKDLQQTDDRIGTRLGTIEQKVLGTTDSTVIATRLSRSVFTVHAGDLTGSAFVAQVRGGVSYLVTNFHVIGAEYASGGRAVDLQQGDRHYTGRVAQTSSQHDLAAIRVDSALPTLPIASGRPAVGEPVVVAGSPLDMEGTITTGVVSAYRTEHGVDYMQFSAPVGPGSSGGPVVDRSGRVVGVTAAKLLGPGAEGLGFAIPIRVACGDLGVC